MWKMWGYDVIGELEHPPSSDYTLYFTATYNVWEDVTKFIQIAPGSDTIPSHNGNLFRLTPNKPYEYGIITPVLGTVLPSGDEREVEIRGCSIWAVELIRQQVEEILGSLINSILIDYYLWDSATANVQLNDSSPDHPIHRTRSLYY